VVKYDVYGFNLNDNMIHCLH